MTDQEIFEAAKDAFWTNVDKEIFAIEGESTVNITADIYGFARDIISRAIPEGHVVVPGWLPIESAPKDGTEIISAQRGTTERGVIFWDDVMQDWCSPGEDWRPPNWEPTHWMPLPAAPANKEGA